jgi:hypothetical protein
MPTQWINRIVEVQPPLAPPAECGNFLSTRDERRAPLHQEDPDEREKDERLETLRMGVAELLAMEPPEPGFFQRLRASMDRLADDAAGSVEAGAGN